MPCAEALELELELDEDDEGAEDPADEESAAAAPGSNEVGGSETVTGPEAPCGFVVDGLPPTMSK